MKFIGRLMALSLTLFGLIVLQVKQAQADVKTQNADFEVQPILPNEQENQSLNYFDLNLAKGQRKTIEMRIQNFTDHKITVYSDLRNALTQVGGGIDFQTSIKDLDPSLEHPFNKIATLEKKDQKIDLKPQQTKILKANIKMPGERTNGMIYGDWHFIEYMNKQGGQASVSSNYAYSVGVSLRGEHYKVYPELKYDKAEAMLYRRHPAMGVKIRNTQPMVVNNVTAKAVVSKEGLFGSKHVFNMSKKAIAPNSVLTMPISWDYDQLKPGKYTVETVIKGENLWNKLPMTWHFKKHFTIKADNAKSINAQALKKPTNKWAYVATASGILMLVSATGLVKVLRRP
ncbi:DUF916 and DUF3324 domain-containing protein [Latilactobacillus curvatus]|uniref:DUF916 and DUF3324 domain-containing protein n=1 Tax=Latilactobacillus curvatus TaxID=28038 RepID=UPI000FECBFD9|nr:DUF916 and DUF3324 domain-containing protein [Latilactobacillus curvatus]MDT3394723.1 DUF916 and DUF3324 domain-containing protein [Bacillota bacterium]QAR36163.1 DUF916 and DUF3324 domain-containing protein [Latilactobacillus curvatus]